MFFSELYSAYYVTVANVLREAVTRPVSQEDIRIIVEKYAFGESILSIPTALKEERWPLLRPDGTAVLKHQPSMPLTTMEKRWLKSVACDPRIKLFGEIDLGPDFDGVEPLFLPEDVIVFDRFTDGDDYTDETYIANFRLILDAIRKKYLLDIESLSGRGRMIKQTVLPRCLEYSEKDDKFRLRGACGRFGSTLNLGRIVSCRASEEKTGAFSGKNRAVRSRTVTFQLVDERKALERVLLHFAHFEKSAEKLDDKHYSVTIHYDKEDETELVIRILSFGPLIRVTTPQHFVDLIKQRLADQRSIDQIDHKSCGQ
ncbi:WYL domain-containing protein [Mobilibacterium timonense]|uniref:WYL domain-containing protein n=1 Tax=Mobilibacterium timonense TaxID=1871012 RepID=UPI003A8E9DED